MAKDLRSINKFTDVSFLIIFIVFSSIMICLACFAVNYGNPLRLIYNMDSFGNLCGTKNAKFGSFELSGKDMSQKKYIFTWPNNVLGRADSIEVCVEKCPESPIKSNKDLYSFYNQNHSSLCRYDYEWSESQLMSSPFHMDVMKTQCPSLPISPSPAMYNRCIPSKEEKSYPSWSQILGDIINSSFIIGGVSLLIIGLTSLLVYIVLRCSKRITFDIIIGFNFLAFAGLTVYLWMLYSPSGSKPLALCMVAILSTICMIFCIPFSFIFMKNKMLHDQLIKLYEEVRKAVDFFKSPVIGYLIFGYIALIAFFSMWLFFLLCFASADNPTLRESSLLNYNIVNETRGAVGELLVLQYNNSAWVKYTVFFHLLTLPFFSQLILGLVQMSLALDTCHYYYNQDRPECNSMISVLKWHLGSIVFGSVAIPLTKPYRTIMRLLTCDRTTPCLGFHHNTYPIVGIQGYDFIPASKITTECMGGYEQELRRLSAHSEMFLFLVKCLVTCCGCLGQVLFMQIHAQSGREFVITSFLIVLVFSYFLAHLGCTIIEIPVDTLILCYTEDTNRNRLKNNENVSLPNRNIVTTNTDTCEKLSREQTLPLQNPNESSFKTFVKRYVATKDNHPVLELTQVDA